MRKLAIVLLVGCAVERDDEDTGAVCPVLCADGTCAVVVDGVPDCSVGEESSSGEGSSSSGGDVVPYGPCESDDDCPIVPGPDGVADASACYQGTCSYRCLREPDGNEPGECPLYDATQCPTVAACSQGWCGLLPRDVPPGECCDGTGNFCSCPDGMSPGTATDVPTLACVWDPS